METAISVASARLEFSVDQPIQMNRTVSFVKDAFQEAAESRHVVLLVSVDDEEFDPAVITETPIGACVDESLDYQGTSPSMDFDIWESEDSMEIGAGDHAIEAFLVSGSEVDFDVTGDGRLAASDVDALDAIVGTAAALNAENLERWDFDRDGKIDADDVAVIAVLVDAGAGSGVFADADGSESVDCDDYAAASPFPLGAEICDEEYVAELDFDIDGVIDAADLVAFMALRGTATCCPGDVNFDGIVNSADFTVISTYFNQTVPAGAHGDANYDGIVNSADFTVVSTNWACSS
jgi:hypothetical protein